MANWTYKHEFGVIHVESWGDPILVLTEKADSPNKTDGHSTYYVLEKVFDVNSCHLLADLYNAEYKLPQTFDVNGSTKLLTIVQTLFPSAEILNPEFKAKLFDIK